MEKQKKSAGTVALVVLLLIVTIASLVLATYAWARYTTIEAGEAVANIAKWNVKFTTDDTRYVQTYNYVAPTNIAPGTSGEISTTITDTGTEVDYYWTLTLNNLQNKPTNLHFYTSSDHSEASVIDFKGTAGANTGLTEQLVTIGHSATSPKIYWNWEYETDTAITVIPDYTVTGFSSLTYGTEKEARAIHDLKAYATKNNVTLADTDTTVELITTKLTAAGKTAAEVNKVVNNAIDTIDGEKMGDLAMTLDVVFEAWQRKPSE